MNVNRKILVLALAGSVAVAVGCAAGLGWMYRTVRTYEKKHKVSVLVPGNEITVRTNSCAKAQVDADAVATNVVTAVAATNAGNYDAP